MRRQSAQARTNGVTRTRLRWQLLVDRGPDCQGCHLTPVGGRKRPRPWQDLHEVLTRARGGSPIDPANILCLCRDCHAWVTTHEEAAQELGLVRSRTAAEHQAAFRITRHNT